MPEAGEDTTRVVYLWPQLYRVGGVQRFIIDCLRGLPKFGISTFVATLREQGDRRKALRSEFGRQIIEWRMAIPDFPVQQMREAAVPIRVQRLLVRITGYRKRWGIWTFRLLLLWRIARARPDVVVINEWWRIELSQLLKDHCAVIGIWHSNKLQDGYYESAKEYGDCLSALVGVSQATTDNLIRIGGPQLIPKISTIEYGIARKSDRWPNRDFTGKRPLKIAYVGRFEEPQKRISDVPKILAALQDIGASFEATLAGEGPEYERIQQEFETLGVDGIFLGSVSPEEVDRIWEAHEVMLLTSNYEGFPFALLEALRMGCVPVVSRFQGGPVSSTITSGENGFIFEIGDINAAAMRLYSLWSDRSLLERLSKAAFETSREYGLEEMLSQYAGLFHRVASASKPHWSVKDYATLFGRYFMSRVNSY